MNIQDYVFQITTLHHDCIINWKKTGTDFTHQSPFALIEENHAYNFLLWHEEDSARRDDLGYEFVYRAKRNIDHYNQQRNNRMEAIDESLFKQLNPASTDQCTVHSETPGQIIDRLSILALKYHHMKLESIRPTADNHHKEHCSQKASIIQAQQNQLQQCLQQLLLEVQQKTRTFVLYHQFKMYNDPSLNPELRRSLKTE